MSNLSYQIPVVPEPRPDTDDPALLDWARVVTSAINQLNSSLNTVLSNASIQIKGF